MKPLNNETKAEFVERGMLDESMVAQYPDRVSRRLALSNLFPNTQESIPVEIKVPKSEILNDIRAELVELVKELPIPVAINGKDGEAGKDGAPGYTPVRGRDYFTPQDIEALVGEVLRQVPEPKVIEKIITKKVQRDLTQAEVDEIAAYVLSLIKFPDLSGKDLVKRLESLKGEARLDASAIKNLPVSYVGGGGGGSSSGEGGEAVWGSITGTLSNQTDLQTALNGKLSTTSTTADVPDSANRRYVTDAQLTVISNTSGTNTGNETTTSIGGLINGADAKSTPVDADFFGLMDSAASNVLKKLSWANVKATLKTYFDTLYSALGHTHTYRYVINLESANEATPTDGATIHFGSAGISTGTAAQMSRTIPVSGTIKAVYINWWGATAGSGEDIVASIRLNDTTDIAVQTVGNTNSVKTFSNTGLNQAVVAGDLVCGKMVYPTWATNPANVRRSAYIVIEATTT